MVISIFFFMMQVGFAFMASGAAASKNASTVLTNHGLIICSTSLVFLLVSCNLTQDARGGLSGTPFETTQMSETD